MNPDNVERLKTGLYELISRYHESRGTFLSATYRNAGVDWKVIPDKIGKSGQR